MFSRYLVVRDCLFSTSQLPLISLCRDSSVDIVTKLHVGFPRNCSSFPSRGKTLLQSVPAGCGNLPASSAIGFCDSEFLVGEVAGLEAGHSPPASSDAKNEWSYTFTPHITSWPAQG
jgi:hypothetical protein